MILKLLGSAFIIISCFGFGFMIAAFHKKEVLSLKQLIYAIDFMACELQYRIPSLPELCRRTSEQCSGGLMKVFQNLSYELDDQLSPDVKCCMDYVLSQTVDIPKETKCCLTLLGENLGRFDLPGQLKALASIKLECENRLHKMQKDSDIRLRSYRTLGLCGGIALIILLL